MRTGKWMNMARLLCGEFTVFSKMQVHLYNSTCVCEICLEGAFRFPEQTRNCQQHFHHNSSAQVEHSGTSCIAVLTCLNLHFCVFFPQLFEFIGLISPLVGRRLAPSSQVSRHGTAKLCLGADVVFGVRKVGRLQWVQQRSRLWKSTELRKSGIVQI